MKPNHKMNQNFEITQAVFWQFDETKAPSPAMREVLIKVGLFLACSCGSVTWADSLKLKQAVDSTEMGFTEKHLVFKNSESSAKARCEPSQWSGYDLVLEFQKPVKGRPQTLRSNFASRKQCLHQKKQLTSNSPKTDFEIQLPREGDQFLIEKHPKEAKDPASEKLQKDDESS